MRFPIFHIMSVTRVNQIFTRLKTGTPIYWDSLKTVNKELLTKKITSINDWYTKLLHLDEVKLYQDRVVTLQDRLLEAQDKRREVGRHLAETRKKSNQLQDEIHKVRRQEDIDRFLALMKEETEVLKLEHEIARTFQECDQAERELFTAFTNAVRDSHQKQRAQLEYSKYFGIILSIVGSFLAFGYSTFRKDDLKTFIENCVRTNTVNLIEKETVLLHDKINFSKSEIVHMIKTALKADEESKTLVKDKINFNEIASVHIDEQSKKLLYYIGFGVLLVILITRL